MKSCKTCKFWFKEGGILAKGWGECGLLTHIGSQKIVIHFRNRGDAINTRKDFVCGEFQKRTRK